MRLRARDIWTSLSLVPRAAVVVASVAIAVLAGYFVLKWLPQWLASGDVTGKDKAEEVGRTRTAVLAVLAGLIAVVGAMFTGLSYRLNRAGQITERFTRAIDQLGSPTLDVRLGGIYALERIARDSKDDHPQVVEVLTAYVREHARWPKQSSETPAQPGSETSPPTGPIEAIRALERIATGTRAENSDEPSEEPAASEDDELLPLPTDVQAAMSVLGRRKGSQDRARLTLSRTDLRGLRLVPDEADLERADLSGANLQGAELRWAKLREADLSGTNLRYADLSSADLADAKLIGADLQHAQLSLARLQGANLVGADLRAAHSLDKAHLDRGLYASRRVRIPDSDRDEGLSSTAVLLTFGMKPGEYPATQWPEGFDPPRGKTNLSHHLDSEGRARRRP